MFPKFSDILNYLFGSHLDLPMQTYGFFLAIAFLTAGLLLRSELKRKEKEGLLTIRKQTIYPNKPVSWFGLVPGIILSSIIGWKLFGIIFQYSDFASNPQKFLLSSKGSLSALLIILCISILYQLYKRRNASKSLEQSYEEIIHPYQNTWNILVVGIILAIIGSKLFDIIDNFSDFLQNPIHSLILFSGLTFYGGFIVTVIGLLFYMRIIRLDWKHVIDSTAPIIMIGYAIGRLGCHFSGDGCWGIVNTLAQPGWLCWLPDWLWASNYPHNVINHGIPIPGCFGPNCHVLDKPVFPTSLYESIISFCSFGILWFMRKRIKAPVSLFGLYLILNGTERFFIEKIRINNKYDFLGLQLTQAEIISSALIIIGICVMIYFSKRYKDQSKEIIS